MSLSDRILPVAGECRLWHRGKNSEGYGQRWVNGKPQYVHRLAWEEEHGPIPAGMVIDHLCRTRHCYRVSHLRLVTVRQNVLENSHGPAATNLRKTHCAKGHPYDMFNTRKYRSQSGALERRRRCRTCQLAWSKRYHQTHAR